MANALRAARTRLEGPYRLVLLFVFLYYAFPMMANLPGVRALRPVMLLLVVIGAWLILEKTASGEPFALSWPESHALVLFLAAGGLSAMNSYWPGQAVRTTMELSKGVLIYFFIVNVVTDRRRLRGVYWALVLGGAFAAVSTLRMFFSGIVSAEGRAIYAGVFRNPNDLAMALTVVMPLAVCLFRGSRPAARVFLAGAFAVCGMAVFFTFSRGGLVGFAAAMFALTVRSGGATRRAMVAVVLAAVLMFPLYADYWQRDRAYSNLEEDVTFQGRVVSVQVGIAMFLESPLVGIGIGVSSIGFAKYAPRSQQNAEALIHNTFVQVLAETGLLGSILYFTALGLSLLRVDRIARGATRLAGGGDEVEMRSYATGMVSSVVGFCVCAMAGPYITFWVPLYLIAICSAIRKIVISEQRAVPEQLAALAP